MVSYIQFFAFGGHFGVGFGVNLCQEIIPRSLYIEELLPGITDLPHMMKTVSIVFIGWGGSIELFTPNLFLRVKNGGRGDPLSRQIP